MEDLFSSTMDVVNDTALNETISYPCNIPPFFPPSLGIPEAVNIIQACIAVLSAVIGLPMNIYLFIIIIKYPELHQRSLYLSLQIIFIEILYHMVIPATILVSTIKGYWIFGEVFCDITGMVHDAFAMFRFTMTLVLTIDRFISVYKPFFYMKHGAVVAWMLSAMMWLITVIRVVLPLTGVLDCFTYIPTFKTCTAFPGCSDSCEYFTAWSVTQVVLSGVVLPLLLYAIIFIIVHRITRYHIAIQASIREGRRRESKANESIRRYNNEQQTKKKFVTVSILLTSIIGTTPAFTLYMASVFYRQPNKVLFIVNMLIGRTSFNLIPVFDSIAFSRHQDIKKVSLKVFRSVRHKVTPETRNLSFSEKSRSLYEHRKSLSEPRKSLSE